VFQSSVHDALRSLEAIDLSEKQDVFASLRANLTRTDLEWLQFKKLFDEFWTSTVEGIHAPAKAHRPRKRTVDTPSATKCVPDADMEIAASMAHKDEREWLEGMAYSPVSQVHQKDLGSLDKADIQMARLALKKMVEPFRIHPTRRSRSSLRSGDMDFRRIMRKSLKNEGIPLELFYREKKKRLKRLVLLADVSGSMERYARFVMPFILGFRGIGSRAEVFVFATSLTSITFIVRHMRTEKALKRISQEVPEWSGGTRIGYSLRQFNQIHGPKLVNRRTVVVILSDGWDLGGTQLLRREMEMLARNAHCIIWLNPLAGDPNYEPVCRGMQTALPYVDYFFPADSLQSLKRVGKLISRIMIH
jgi:hypothetical protein